MDYKRCDRLYRNVSLVNAFLYLAAFDDNGIPGLVVGGRLSIVFQGQRGASVRFSSTIQGMVRNLGRNGAIVL